MADAAARLFYDRLFEIDPTTRPLFKLADGHQAIQSIAFGRTKYNPDLKRVDLVDIQYFPAECVNPPPGVKALDWIKGGMQGAKCN